MLTLVADTNIVFSAIIKPGRIRELVLDERIALYAPEELLLELNELKTKILKHTRLTEEELTYIIQVLANNIITIVPRETYKKPAQKALTILAETDPSDTPFVALTIYLGAPLWTGDKRLIRLALKTGEFRAVDTRGVEMLLQDKPWSEVEEEMRKRYL